MPKRHIRLSGLLAASATIIAPAFWAAPAQAQATPDTLISVCSGVSLPRSVVTGIMDPVVTGIYGPIETNINQTLGALGVILGLPAPLSVDVTGLLATAASGSDIGINVLAQDGSLVAPGDECNAQADSYTLDNPAGISIGGNAITGLGDNGEEAQAGEIDSIAIGNRASTDAAALESVALGTDASVGAGGTGSVALGAGSSVGVANSVALGADSVASRGPQAGYAAFGLVAPQNSAGEVSVGAPGAERQITNVAAGSAPTDAVNLAQLQAIAGLIPSDAVEYDDPGHSIVTLGGVGGTTVTNVAAGALNALSTDAVNGSQLFATNQQVQSNTLAIVNLQTDFTNLQIQVDGIVSGGVGPVQYSNPGTPTVPNGGIPTNDVTLVGAAAGPVGIHNVADGVVAAGSTDAVNGGQLFLTNQTAVTAQDTADDALVLANNSVQYDGPTHTSVTLNNGGTAVTVHNVAAGTAATDAVNVGQLDTAMDNAVTTANAYTDARIASLDFDLTDVRGDISRARKESRAGSAAALAAAALPQPLEPGKSMIAAGVGTYRGRTAVAIGASHVHDNGKSVFKVGLTYDSSEHVGANAGFGVQF
jgi:autotransporter adhesin